MSTKNGSDETIPTWGFAASGDAKIFQLPKGEGLPEGWADTPAAYHAAAAKPAATSVPIDEARAAELKQKGIDAATANKGRKPPPAYINKPEGEKWLEGFDSVVRVVP
jgi:hypothetical protein